MFLILTFIAVVLLYLHMVRNFNYWKNRNVPHLKPVALFGNVFKLCILKISMWQFLHELHKATKAPYFGFFVFDQPFLLIRDPELIKQILIKDFKFFEDRAVTDNKRDDLIGSSILFVTKNPDWKTIRTKVIPVFSSAKMKNMLHLIVEASEELADYVSRVAVNEKSTETREVLMKFTTNVISSCAFGINANCFEHENAEFRVAARRIFDWSFKRATQMASYFFAPVLVKLFRMKFLDPIGVAFLKEVFSKTLSDRETSSSYRGDLVDILMKIKKESSASLNDLDEMKIIAQAIQFFIGGFETTGSTTSFALYELGLNPSVQDRLRKEIRGVLKKYGEITYEAIQEMNYLDMVISETLRKYPIMPFVDRRCTKPYQIPDSDVIIEKGIPIYISLAGLHYDPEYFPNPENFDPDRFAPENKTTRHSCIYMPFGEGPRNCIGARFGLMTSKVALIRLLSSFAVELSNDSPVPLQFNSVSFLLAPENGLQLHFKHVSVSD